MQGLCDAYYSCAPDDVNEALKALLKKQSSKDVRRLHRNIWLYIFRERYCMVYLPTDGGLK